jgi:hypothetical protein
VKAYRGGAVMDRPDLEVDRHERASSVLRANLQLSQHPGDRRIEFTLRCKHGI